MIFKANEAVGGLKHAGLKWQRLALKRPIDSYVPRFEHLPLAFQPSADSHGEPLLCAICGYTLMRAKLDNGWSLDVCSAMPVLDFNSPAFLAWQKALPREKLPTSCV